MSSIKAVEGRKIKKKKNFSLTGTKKLINITNFLATAPKT